MGTKKGKQADKSEPGARPGFYLALNTLEAAGKTGIFRS